MNDSKNAMNGAPENMLAALEPDQLIASKKRPLPRRSLSPMETLTLWALRLYLVSVMGILLYQVISR